MSLITFLLFLLGFVLLLGGAELLVRGASQIAVAAGISPLVVGLTVVAYGTSAPELAVSVQSAFAGNADLAVGNVVGSNISNILLVLGIAATLAPLAVARQLVRTSLPVMILVSVLMLVFGIDGTINRWEGLALFAGALAFTWISIQTSRRATRIAADETKDQAAPRTSVLRMILNLGLVVAGLGLLVLGAGWLVDGAVELAQWFGINELVIGLTIVAVGTSLPEIATSIVAAARGQRDIAVGNAVGSNIFNVLLVIGLSSAVAPEGIKVAETAVRFDMPVMIAVAIACLPVFFSGYVIDRWEGLVFVAYYASYATYLYLDATGSPWQETFQIAMLYFVIPITLVALVATTVRAIRRPR